MNLRKHAIIAKIALAMVGFCALLSTSCTQEESVAPGHDAPAANGVGTNTFGGQVFLVFENQAVFDAAKATTANQNPAMASAWEKQFVGFVSQQSHYERALENIGHQRQTAADYAGQNSIFKAGEDGLALKIAYEPGIARLVNAQGVVQIGQRVFRYAEGGAHIIEDGDVAKLAILAQYPMGDKDQRINYLEVKERKLAAKNLRLTNGQTCEGIIGGQKVRGSVSAYESRAFDWNAGTVTVQARFIVGATNFEYLGGILGWVRKPTGGLRITGNISARAGAWTGGGFFNRSTTGQQKNYISYAVYSPSLVFSVGSPIPPYYFVPFSLSGYASCYGRGGTFCGLGSNAFGAPTNVQAAYQPASPGDNEGDLTVTWNPVNGAASYNIYTLSGGNFTLYRTVNTNRWRRDIKERFLGSFRVRVSAVSSTGAESAQTEASYSWR